MLASGIGGLRYTFYDNQSWNPSTFETLYASLARGIHVIEVRANGGLELYIGLKNSNLYGVFAKMNYFRNGVLAYCRIYNGEFIYS